jgi:hypothetical protein
MGRALILIIIIYREVPQISCDAGLIADASIDRQLHNHR